MVIIASSTDRPLHLPLQLEKLKESHDRELDSIQSELDSTHSQLTTTQDNLNEALINLQECNFIILTQQRAEHALAGHAQNLTAQLSNCSHDLGIFYKKLDEVMELMQADRCSDTSTSSS
jgi:Skp family chaperone for outer membrane proteins